LWYGDWSSDVCSSDLMPLTWSQVRKDLDPKRFTIHTVPRLLKTTDAWKDYGAAERPLKAAIKSFLG
jgi:bifunctional non-homologous end joining protein LigD